MNPTSKERSPGAVDLSALREALTKTSISPWRADGAYVTNLGRDLVSAEDCDEDDLKFIALARNEMPYLIAELEAARAEVARLSGVLGQIEGGDNPCRDESVLRQWAYEALTLRRGVEELS